MSWIDVLSGAPDTIKTDAGRQFDSKKFKGSAKAQGIQVQVVPTEAHHKIGLVERYHRVVRSVYEKLKIDDPTMSRELRLSTTFRCVNDTAGFDGVVPTLLVFGTYPRIGTEQHPIAPTTLERANAVLRATKLAVQLIDEERLKHASKNGPTANAEIIDAVKRLTRNAPVLVHREKGGWTGPIKFIGADDHGVWVRNEKGNEVRVSIHVVKPYIPERWTLNTAYFAKTTDPLFKRNIWHYVDRTEARGNRIYHGRWIDQIKKDGTPKSRLVICATNDYLDH
eukprot:IDg11021t1